jgi:hypothetical protein
MLMLASVSLVFHMCVSSGAGCTARSAGQTVFRAARNLQNMIARGKEAGAGLSEGPQAAAAE